MIAGLKIAKGALLLVVGLGFLKLVHAEIATLFSRLLETFNLDDHARLLHALVLKVDTLQPKNILLMSVTSFLFAGLELTEGLGLWFERAWAAYLTVITTSLFIPFELYELAEQLTVARVGILLLNLVIVLYLFSHLKHRTLRSAKSSQSPF